MIPQEINNCRDYLNSVLTKSEAFDLIKFDPIYQDYFNYINNIFNSWFPNTPEYSDEHVAEILFIKEIRSKTYANWVRIEFYAMLKSTERIYNKINKYSKSNDSEYLIYEISLFNEMLFEVAAFLNDSSDRLNKNLNYRCGKRNILHSLEVYYASLMSLRQMNDQTRIGQFAMPALSIFAIRQAIELRLRYSLGILMICDNQGKMIRVTGEKFIDVFKRLAKNNSKGIIFPMKYSVLLKIFNWSQYYIHGGIVFNIWEIEWAHYLLEPLFSSGSDGNTTSRFGAIKIKKELYEKIPNIVKEIINRPRSGLFERLLMRITGKNRKILSEVTITRLDDPECLIIS